MRRTLSTVAWIATAAIAAVLFAGLGRVALLDPDEGRYAVAAREMLASGDAVVPSFNGEPRLNKPPLLYWAIAVAFAAIGESELSARLPSAIAGLLTVALTGWWAARRFGEAARAPAMAALATTPILFACARLAITDMALTLCVTAAIVFWDESVRTTPGSTARRRLLAAAASAAGGMAFLAKGPVGPLLPALVILVVTISDRLARGGRAAAHGLSPRLLTLTGVSMGAAGLALLAGPWCALFVDRIGLDRAIGIVREEVMERALTGLDHPRPFWYLLATFWPLFIPWSLAIPGALLAALRGRSGRGDATRSESSGFRLITIWISTVLAFFTLLPGKNDAWLLPAAPAVALLAAWRWPRRTVLALSAFMGAALLVALIAYGGTLSERRSTRDAVIAAGLARHEVLTLLSYKLYKPSVVWYAGHAAQWLTSEEELAAALAARDPGKPAAILMEERRMQQVGAMLAGFTVAGRQRGYVVLVSP